MRIPDAKLAEIWDQGFTIVEGFLDKQTLAAAQAALWDIYPTARGLFRGPGGPSRISRRPSSPGSKLFPYAAWALSRLPVYPDLIDAAERFLKTPAVDMLQDRALGEVRRRASTTTRCITATTPTTPSWCRAPTG